MSDIRGAVVHAAIMASIATLKEECKNHPLCNGCPFEDVTGECIFYCLPEKYDINKIRYALQKAVDNV